MHGIWGSIMHHLTLALTATATFGLLAASPAAALDLAGLNNRNELLLFSDKAPGKAKLVPLTGITDKLLGIDVRPADGLLYGIGSDSTIYTIDTASGQATIKGKLSVPLDSIDHIVVDFNPQADRLRVIGSSGQNLRINVDTGQTVVDGKLAYRSGDINAGKPFGIYAGAYINSYAGAKHTQLFDIDSRNGVYVAQDPPNDGALRSIGPTGLKAGNIVDALDIYTDAQDEYVGFAVAGASLYRLDVGSGKMNRIGAIGNGSTAIIDIAVLTKSR